MTAQSHCSSFESWPDCNQKPARVFLQLDGWKEAPAGLSEHERSRYAARPDEDGEIVMSVTVIERRNTDFPLRIQIHEGAEKELVLRLLGKMTAALEHDLSDFALGNECDVPF